MDYIIENMQWIFSGIGVFVFTIIFYFRENVKKAANLLKLKTRVLKTISI